VNDTDVLTDWYYYYAILANTKNDYDGVAAWLIHFQLMSCIAGTVSWVIIASDGRVLDWCRSLVMHLLLLLLKIFGGIRKCGAKLRHCDSEYDYHNEKFYRSFEHLEEQIRSPFQKGCRFPTGALLILGIFLEDLPQVFVTFMIEDFQGNEEGGISSSAQLNLVLAFFDIGHKLAEAWDSRADMVKAGDSLLGEICKHSVRSLASMGGSRLLSGGDRVVKLYEFSANADGEDVALKRMCDFDVDGDVEEMVALDTSRIAVRYSNMCTVIDVETEKDLGSLHHPNKVTSVAVSPDGGCLLTGCVDRIIRKWKVSSPFSCIQQWECILPSKDYNYRQQAFLCDMKLIFFDNDQVLVGDSSSDTVHLTKVADGAVVRSFETGNGVHSICTMNSTSFLTGHQNGRIHQWKTDELKKYHTFKGHDEAVVSIAQVDEFQFVSGSKDESAMLWDLRSRYRLHSFSGHADPLKSVVFFPAPAGIPAGRKLLTASDDKTDKVVSIKVWGLEEFKSEVEEDWSDPYPLEICYRVI